MPSSASEGWEARLREELRALEAGLPSASDPAGRYERRAELGRGGMGAVFRGWDRVLKRDVAIKVIPGNRPTGVELARFQREAEIAARLSHPNVVSVFDAGEENGQAFLVMELVEGATLGTLFQEGKTDGDLVRILELAARGVGAAHARGIVHRDLKPDNILIAPGMIPKVADFGLAHGLQGEVALTQSGTILGTPEYMPPEQAAGRLQEVSPRSDVYSLGAILYRILTGRTPHPAETVAEMVAKIVNEDPAPPRSIRPGIPVDLEIVCLKAMDRDPVRRYPDATAFADDLARFLAGEPVLAKPASALHLLGRKLRANRASLAWMALILVLAGGLLTWGVLAGAASNAFHAAYHAGMESWDRGTALMRAADADRESAAGWIRRAAGDFEKAAEADPRRTEAWLMIGRCRSLLGEHSAAEAALSEAVRREGGPGRSRFERGRFFLGVYLAVRPPPLVWTSGGTVRVGPRPAETADERAWRMKGEDDLREARRLGGLKSAELAFLEGALAYGEDRYADAAGLLDTYLQACPWDARAFALCGTSRFLAGDFAGAEAALTRALALEGRSDWRRARAAARSCRGRAEPALADLEEILRADPADAEALCERGTVLSMLGRTGDAEASFTRAIEFRPRLARAHNNRGIVRAGRQDLEGAEGDFRQAIFLDPLYAEACNNLGAALLLAGRVDEALEEFDAALEIRRDYSDALLNRGKARRVKGRLREGIADFRRAAELAPRELEPLLQLAQALQADGNPAEALSVLRSAVALEGPEARREAARRLLREWSGE